MVHIIIWIEILANEVKGLHLERWGIREQVLVSVCP